MSQENVPSLLIQRTKTRIFVTKSSVPNQPPKRKSPTIPNHVTFSAATKAFARARTLRHRCEEEASQRREQNGRQGEDNCYGS